MAVAAACAVPRMTSWRRDYNLDAKWRINRFLQKWLGYCLRQGHRFRAIGSDSLTPAGQWPEMLATLGQPSQNTDD